MVCLTVHCIPVAALLALLGSSNALGAVSRAEWPPMTLSSWWLPLVALGAYYILLAGPLTLGCTQYYLALVRNESPGYRTVFHGFTDYRRAVSTHGLITLALGAGYLCCLIPGMVANVGLSLALFVLADNPAMSATHSLPTAWALVWRQGHWMKIYCLFMNWTVLMSATLLAAWLALATALPWASVSHGLFTPMLCSGVVSLTLLPMVWVSVAMLYNELVRPNNEKSVPDFCDAEAPAVLSPTNKRAPTP
eukprot:EG_transcript_14323